MYVPALWLFRVTGPILERKLLANSVVSPVDLPAPSITFALHLTYHVRTYLNNYNSLELGITVELRFSKPRVNLAQLLTQKYDREC